MKFLREFKEECRYEFILDLETFEIRPLKAECEVLYEFGMAIGGHPLPYEILSQRGSEFASPWATWWLAREPGMDYILVKGEESLERILERVSPVMVKHTPTVFLARYEIPQFMKPFRYPEGVPKKAKDLYGFVHFLIGVPWGNVEVMGIFGEYTTDLDSIAVNKSSKPVPEPPEDLFVMSGVHDVPFRKMWALKKPSEIGRGLKPLAKYHAWLYYALRSDDWPIPGEFVGLLVRLMPFCPHGHQKTNPFLFSGNWLDTVYYTSGVIKKAEPPRYLVLWQGLKLWLKSTDYAIYKVGDRVTILKNVGTKRETQTWDVEREALYFIAPITFYGGK